VSPLKSPEELAADMWPLPGHDNTVSRAAGALAIRKRDAQWKQALIDEAHRIETGSLPQRTSIAAHVRDAAKIGGAS
jgi:hypothetical protein